MNPKPFNAHTALKHAARARRLVLVVAAAVCLLFLAAPPARAATGPHDLRIYNPFELTSMNGTLFFRAPFGNGSALWKSDGTKKGTIAIKSIEAYNLTSRNKTLFFTADQHGHSQGLWKTDGTPEGTFKVRNFRPDGGSTYVTLSSLTAVQGALFFVVNIRSLYPYSPHHSDLWKTDGTLQGTVKLKSSIYPTKLIKVNETLFFVADDGTHGFELWKSDGTKKGTVMIKDINPSGSSGPFNLTNAKGTLFFGAGDDTHGVGLWKSDGTPEGTVLLKTVLPHDVPTAFQSVDRMLFFAADDGIHGVELWKSDGTPDGTVMLKDINTNAAPFDWGDPRNLTNVNGTLFFTADDGIHGFQLWKSDGTPDGTVMVKDINPSSSLGSIGGFIKVRGTLCFVNDDNVYGVELWRSNGKAKGTVMVRDIRPGSLGSYPHSFTRVNDKLFFVASRDYAPGVELWVYEP